MNYAVSPHLKSKSVLGILTLLAAMQAAVACRSPTVVNGKEGKQMPGSTLEEVYARHSEELMAISGVIGIAIGKCEGNPCIRVMVDKKSAELLRKLPSQLEGYPVAVQETGPIRALNVGG